MLADHITQSGETQAAWAERIGISRPYLNALMKRAKTPSLPVALRIERLTEGAVPASSWVPDTPAPATEGGSDDAAA